MSAPEIIATLLGLANIVLLVRRSIWNYPFGIAMVAIYAWVFFAAKLYSDSLLQLFFLAIQLYGWRVWAREGGDARPIGVLLLAWRARLAWLAVGALGAGGWGWVMRHHTDAAYPYWDATVAAYSVCAQVLLARRYLENWVLWVAVDAGAIGLYASKGLYLTAGLYILFLLLAIWGLIEWRRAMRDGGAAHA